MMNVQDSVFNSGYDMVQQVSVLWSTEFYKENNLYSKTLIQYKLLCLH